MRDFPAWGTVPQPSTLPRAQVNGKLASYGLDQLFYTYLISYLFYVQVRYVMQWLFMQLCILGNNKSIWLKAQ
jgi:hypothetical protein